MKLINIINFITEPFSRASLAGKPRVFDSRKLYYMTFEVCDPTTAQKIIDWQEHQEAAHKKIEDHLNKTFSSYAATPFYRLTKDGYIKDVAFCGHTPEGWSEGPEAELALESWVEPVDSLEMKKIMALPAAPGHHQITQMLNWPYFETQGKALSEKIRLESVNRSFRLQQVQGRVLVHLPHPNNFKSCPEIAAHLRTWQPPDFLKVTNDGALIRLRLKL